MERHGRLNLAALDETREGSGGVDLLETIAILKNPADLRLHRRPKRFEIRVEIPVIAIDAIEIGREEKKRRAQTIDRLRNNRIDLAQSRDHRNALHPPIKDRHIAHRAPREAITCVASEGPVAYLHTTRRLRRTRQPT